MVIDFTREVHIQVSEFDSIQQANLWREKGSVQATAELISALRMAVYLGNEITLDRNQLFDGIFFLALGPAGIAEALGLTPGSNLPIHVLCESGTLSTDDRKVPIMRGRQPESGEFVSIDVQLNSVRKDDFRKSSASLIAVCDTDLDNTWLCSDPGKEWYPGCGLSKFRSDFFSTSEIIRKIDELQDAWAEEIEKGNISVDIWGRNLNSGVSEINVQKYLQETKERLLNEGIKMRPLAEFIFKQDTSVRREIVSIVRDWREVNVRECSIEECRVAIQMWTRAYYQAIAEQNNNLYLSFYDIDSEARFLSEYGLSLSGKSNNKFKFKSLARLIRGDSHASSDRILVEGELLDAIRMITSASYQQLYLSTRNLAHALNLAKNPSMMTELSYAAQVSTEKPELLSERRRNVIFSTTLITLWAIAICCAGVFVEYMDYLKDPIRIYLTVGVAVLGAGIPWGGFKEAFQLRKKSRKQAAFLTLRGGGI